MKVGGLGDVVTGLGKELQKRGHLVEIVLPKYDCMNYELIHDLRVSSLFWKVNKNFQHYNYHHKPQGWCIQVLDFEVESYFDGQLFRNKIWIGTVEGSIS